MNTSSACIATAIATTTAIVTSTGCFIFISPIITYTAGNYPLLPPSPRNHQHYSAPKIGSVNIKFTTTITTTTTAASIPPPLLPSLLVPYSKTLCSLTKTISKVLAEDTHVFKDIFYGSGGGLA
ncbi:hypothetical protein E2C01_089537 [Portunus trituberculatus]|uniref:Uncharacterized protein n=1 Tax=Portunus trituberculatus TaxID=210409 RepID=A0A5B7JCA5_PORTR|nr:hypothetical protein [Portunus trituberculatus]